MVWTRGQILMLILLLGSLVGAAYAFGKGPAVLTKIVPVANAPLAVLLVLASVSYFGLCPVINWLAPAGELRHATTRVILGTLQLTMFLLVGVLPALWLIVPAEVRNQVPLPPLPKG